MSDENRWFQPLPEGGYRMRLFTAEIVAAAAKSIVEGGLATGIEEYALSLDILRSFFGMQWAERHIMSDTAPRGFLNRWAEGIEFQTTL